MAFLHQIVFLCVVAAAFTGVVADETAQEKLASYIAEKKPTLNYRYRLRYHVAPPVGWMNDPNGFSYYKGEYHIFYQFYPYEATTGPMHWGHSTSANLVDWKELPTALIPDKEQCFSGSGIVVGDTLILMYTGHVTDPTNSSIYTEAQYLASSTDGVNFQKYAGNPVLSSPNGSPDFRDPKVWKEGNNYYVVIGSKTDEGNGRVVLYRSTGLGEATLGWEFMSVIGQSDGPMGYMWECPDFFGLNGKYVLLMSPQGLEPQGDRYKNTFQTGYIIGSFNYTTGEFRPETEFQEIDFGHDFYATQTIEEGGKRIMLAWFGMWNVTLPEAEDGWAGALTIARELSIFNNRILQKPIEAITLLRESTHPTTQLATNQAIQFKKTAEIIFTANLNQAINILIEGTSGNGANLKWDPSVRKVIVDRGNNDIRQVEWLPIGAHSWRIFLDASSVELFCGEGEVVFSSRVYPNGDWVVKNLSPQTLNIEAFFLRNSVPFPSSATKLNPLLCVIFLMLIPLLSSAFSKF